MKFLIVLLLTLCFALGLPAVDAKDAAAVKATPASPAVPIPETADALWAQIDLQRKALGDAITAVNKAEGSRLADTLKELVKAIPGKYPEAVAEKKKSIHHESKSVARLFDDLRDALQQGKIDQVNLILGQIDSSLKFVRESAAKK
jgi:hypothetical protein